VVTSDAPAVSLPAEARRVLRAAFPASCNLLFSLKAYLPAGGDDIGFYVVATRVFEFLIPTAFGSTLPGLWIIGGLN
jgi:hypothetical protein